jgi:hypothetical protein
MLASVALALVVACAHAVLQVSTGAARMLAVLAGLIVAAPGRLGADRSNGSKIAVRTRTETDMDKFTPATHTEDEDEDEDEWDDASELTESEPRTPLTPSGYSLSLSPVGTPTNRARGTVPRPRPQLGGPLGYEDTV